MTNKMVKKPMHPLVKEAYKLFHGDGLALINRLSAGPATVKRWILYGTTPHPLFREEIRKLIDKKNRSNGRKK